MDENQSAAFQIPELTPDPEAGTGRGVAVLDLLVSLFLILLCFFLVMDSISNQQLVRAHAAVKSVKTTFQKTIEGVKLLELVPRSKQDEASEFYFAAVHAMLLDMVDFTGSFPTRDMVPLRVEVTPDTLFVRGGSRMRFDQSQFLDDMARALKTAPDGEERSVEILVGSGPEMPTGPRMWRNLYVKRAANFARELEDRGVPARLVSTGVAPISARKIWISFLSKRRGLDMGAGAITMPGAKGGDQ